MTTHEVDVAILGGGLAGNLLARQLRRTLPGLRISMFEKATERSYKVGESTVEIASNYLNRRLGLSQYLYDQQLPKNGLRFFFDTPEKDGELEALSEMGSVALPYHPSFQIDRARIEADLLDFNRADGVDVHIGVQVRELTLGSGGDAHTFTVEDGSGAPATWRSRWVVDAAGRASLIARQKGLRVTEVEHPIGAVWGRFRNVRDIDDVGSDRFRARVRYTSRGLSTIHFCYPGYWIWFIPLGRGVISVGIVGAKAQIDRTVRTRQGFLDFVDQHRAAASLMIGAEIIDVGSYAQLAYGTTQFFSADRWGMTGEAAAFTDPFYSPGSDFIALENDYLSDLIRREFAGESASELAERTALYDQFMLFRHEAVMRLYRHLYSTIGSYELFSLKWDLDIASYYHLWVGPYMLDQHLDVELLRTQVKQKALALRALDNFSILFRKVENDLRERGEYHRINLGEFRDGLTALSDVERVGTARPANETLETIARTFNDVRQRALRIIDRNHRDEGRSIPLAAFMAARPLA
jgi:flavin-dependent dehydrogenase